MRAYELVVELLVDQCINLHQIEIYVLANVGRAREQDVHVHGRLVVGERYILQKGVQLQVQSRVEA